MSARIDDPDLDVDESSVLVLRNAGPLGGPGMPEWGMLPIPKKLLKAGVRDMVRISDARMSGTAYGTCVLHVAPESFAGGPLALVQTGDTITLDVPNRRLDLNVSQEELDARRSSWVPREFPATRGYERLFASPRDPGERGLRLRLPPRRRRSPGARDPLMTDRPWDVVVVGAGILGLATARELLHRNPDTRVLVLEREPEIATHQTGHNSGVVHAGIYYAPGSLKAQLCTVGRNALYEYCDEHEIAYETLRQAHHRPRRHRAPETRRTRAPGPRERRPRPRAPRRIRPARDRAPRDGRRRPPLTGDRHHRLRRRRPHDGVRDPGRRRRDPHRRHRPPPLPQRRHVDRRDVRTAQSQRPRPSPAPASGPTASPKPPASPATHGSSRSEAAT